MFSSLARRRSRSFFWASFQSDVPVGSWRRSPVRSRYRIHQYCVPPRLYRTPSCLLGRAIPHLLLETCAKRFEIRFQEPDVSSHNAEMGNLLSLDPKIHGLRTDAKVPRGFANRHWILNVCLMCTR